MRREVIDCDRCGSKDVKGTRTIVMTVDRRMDPAGSMDDVDERVDLCPDCMRKAIYELIPKRDYELAQ